MTDSTGPLRLATTEVRQKLSEIITRIQDPRSYCVLTRHGKPVAAIVSVQELHRMWEQHDIEDVIVHGNRPATFRTGRDGHLTNHEAAEAIQKTQMNRRMEREVLRTAGLAPIPGGELIAEADDGADISKPSIWGKILRVCFKSN